MGSCSLLSTVTGEMRQGFAALIIIGIYSLATIIPNIAMWQCAVFMTKIDLVEDDFIIIYSFRWRTDPVYFMCLDGTRGEIDLVLILKPNTIISILIQWVNYLYNLLLYWFSFLLQLLLLSPISIGFYAWLF